MIDPLDYAELTDTAKAIVRTLRRGPVACGVTLLAEALGVSNRQALRAIAELRDGGMLAVSTSGRGSVYTATCDMEARIRATCHMLKPREPNQYTELRDVQKAREDRARWFYARGYGPAWALELGAELAVRQA